VRQFAIAAAVLTLAAPAAAQIAPSAHGLEAHRGAVLMRIDALTPQVLRVRIGRDGTLGEDASWAIDARTRAPSAPVTATADGFTTAALVVHLDPATLALTVTDRAGKVIVADAAEPIKLAGRRFPLRQAMPLAAHYFGLGDKPGGMARRGGSGARPVRSE
jgi:alpha-glucosidase